jgi:rhodanese-related sulfurtransferase
MFMIENLTPQQCWDVLQQNPAAVLVDVRTKMEHLFVGHPPGAIHIPWKEAPDWQLNSNFVTEVSHNIPDRSAPILLLCRSGQRSLDAAKALEAVGYERLINIVDGFEGSLDTNKHRGNLGGWRFCGLPWQQS